MEVDVPIPKSSVHEYYVQKIEELQLIVNEKGQNLRRLQAQRNELNAKGEIRHTLTANQIDDLFELFRL